MGEDELGGYVGPWSAVLQGFGGGVGWGKVTKARRFMENVRGRAGGVVSRRFLLLHYRWEGWERFVAWERFGGRRGESEDLV